MKTALLLLSMSFISGCASVLNTSISSMAKGPGQRLRAVDVANGYVMMTIPDLDATAKLRAACGGSLTGIQTTTWVRNWFVVQEYHQEAMAWCQQ